MKKVSLLVLVALFLFAGNVKAQDEAVVLIEDDFSAYTVGDKLAQGANALGNNWWTTWSYYPGSAEDGVIAEYDGNKCAHLTFGNDQVLDLGGVQAGVYEIELDILIPEGKNGYFNALHKFESIDSEWAMEAHLHMADYQTPAPGEGHAVGANIDEQFECVYDEWMHFRLVVNTDADLAQFYYTAPDASEVKVNEWQWSLGVQGTGSNRQLDAMGFYPPKDAATSEFYLDNVKFSRIGGETAAALVITPNEIAEGLPQDVEMTEVDINIENTGTSIAEYSAWVDYGVGPGGNQQNPISYASDAINNPKGLGWNSTSPVTFEMAALFPATAYGNAVTGTYITHAMYAFFEWINNNNQDEILPILEPGTDVIFRIYGQGVNGMPGEILAEKTISQDAITYNDYTLVEFDEPVALTGFDVYVAIEVTAAVNGIAMNLDGAQAVQGQGDLYRQNNGAFRSITEDAGSDYGNWCLAMLCQGAPVPAGYATLSKTNGTLAIGASDEITLTLSSIGLDEGVYESVVKFVTNDPANPTIEIPLTLTITGGNVNEVLSNAYNVYPNPTTGAVMVEGENIDYIAVYNSVGQLVNVVKNETNVVDMSSYENGVYFFNIVDNAGQESLQRVVVAK